MGAKPTAAMMRTDDWLQSPALMREWFKDASWSAWAAFSKALYGEPMSAAELKVFQARTGRTVAPTAQAREAWVVVGRRGGKSIVMAREGTRLAVRDYSAILKPGQRAYVVVLAADKDQAQEVMNYLLGFFTEIPSLAALVERRKGKGQQRRDEVRLVNRVVIRVAVASFRKIRGRTIVAAICDELAYWMDSEKSLNPSQEILRALKPAMLTVKDALLLVISSPYRRTGPLWDAVKRFWAKDGPVLVWRGDTTSMNPAADRDEIARAFEEDPVAAASEYGINGEIKFREDLESYISPESVEAVTVKGRTYLPFDPKYRHSGFADPAGGSGADSMTLAIVRRERGKAVVCRVAEWKPRFSPDTACAEASEILKEYRLLRVVGDHYAGDWPKDRFRAHGVTYETADRTKSDFYQGFLPLVNGQRVELLEHQKANGQLCALERSTSRLGKDAISHPVGGHDDLINAVAGACVLALRRPMLNAEGTVERARQTAGTPALDQFGCYEETRELNGVKVVYRVNAKTGHATLDRIAEPEPEELIHSFEACETCGHSHIVMGGEATPCPQSEPWTPQQLMRHAVKPTAHPDIRLVEEGYAANLALTAKTIGWTG